MRIATWNLEGRWSDRHRDFLTRLRSDVLLLTEVTDQIALPGMHVHLTDGGMAESRRWAGIASRVPLVPLPSPNGATALAEIDGKRFASSILPWRSAGSDDPWGGDDVAMRTAHAVAAIEASTPTAWGGDWNHELTGRLYVGTRGGRVRILEALDALGLVAPTAATPHRIAGCMSIDHLAVPASWSVTEVERVSGIVGGAELSDHDAYVLTTEPS